MDSPVDQLWLVDTDLTSEQILMTAPGDRLIITALSTTYLYGWLLPPSDEWKIAMIERGFIEINGSITMTLGYQEV